MENLFRSGQRTACPCGGIPILPRAGRAIAAARRTACKGIPVTHNIRFSINRICASRMSFAKFAEMAQRLGVQAIELRNDLPGVELRDGAAPREIGIVASGHGLAIRSINALQRFDQFDASRRNEAAALMGYAALCGAQALVLCPTNSRADQRGAQQRHDDLVMALAALQPMLADHGLLGLVEALGFEECAVRRKSAAVAALREVGGTGLALVHDTFHHNLAGEDLYFAELTGLVHVSGVDDATIPVDRLRDQHRQLVGPMDRLGNAEQLQHLLARGYVGYVSFEPFADAIIVAGDIEQRLAASMAYLSAAVAASTDADASSVR